MNGYITESMDQPGQGCQSFSWSAEQEKMNISRLRIRSRETGSTFPSRVSLLILHTQADSGPYPRRPSGQSSPEFRNSVTQLRIDGVHCRESAGTEPVVLKVVRVTGAAFASPRWTN